MHLFCKFGSWKEGWETPFLTCCSRSQTTGPGAEPEEQEEDEVERRTLHRFSPLPLHHIVTALLL
jgi:hypothetical protein